MSTNLYLCRIEQSSFINYTYSGWNALEQVAQKIKCEDVEWMRNYDYITKRHDTTRYDDELFIFRSSDPYATKCQIDLREGWKCYYVSLNTKYHRLPYSSSLWVLLNKKKKGIVQSILWQFWFTRYPLNVRYNSPLIRYCCNCNLQLFSFCLFILPL